MNNENAIAEVQPANKALAGFADFDALVEEVNDSESQVQQHHTQMSDGDVAYMNFARHGEQGELSPWSYGQDGKEVDPRAKWAVDPSTLMHGWSGFKKGPGGQIQKGVRPDQVWDNWFRAWPEKPTDPDLDHVTDRAYRFRAVCIDSPDADDIGAFVEVTDWRRMSTGFKQLEQALRQRVKDVAKAKADNETEVVATLMGNFFPVIRLDFEIGVQTNNGKHNRAMIKLEGWTSNVVPAAGEAGPTAPSDEDPEQDLQSEVAKKTAKKTTRRARSRS